MKATRRCSISFHLLVPGGGWLTGILRPISSASGWSSQFQSRSRRPVLPPSFAKMLIERARVRGGPEFTPPAAERVDGEGSRVVVYADAALPDVAPDVVHAVGDRLAERVIDEGVHAHPFRLAFRTPLTPGVF